MTQKISAKKMKIGIRCSHMIHVIVQKYKVELSKF